MGCQTNPNKSVTLIPHTAECYTGTEADFVDIPENERPRPKNSAQPNGSQIGRLWDADSGEYVPGLVFGGCPIGSDRFVTLWLEKATTEICSDIKQTVTTLSSVDVSTAHAATTYSLCTKMDWIIQTNKPSLTRPYAKQVDAALLEAFETISTSLPKDDIDPSFTFDRLQLRLKDGGAGIRLPSSTIDHAYVNTINMVSPILVGGPLRHQLGIAPGLEDALGKDSFADSNRATRWATFIASGLSDGPELVAAHERLKARDEALLNSLKLDGESEEKISALRASSPMLVDTEQLGSYASLEPVLPPGGGLKEKPGKMSRHWWSDVMQLRLSQRASRMPADDIRRVAWFARSQYGSMIFQMPHEVTTLNNDEHREAVCTVLALPSPAAADIVGKEIPTNNKRTSNQHTVDEAGWNLTNATGWEGDNRRTNAHNELEGVFAEALIKGGLPAYQAEKTKERLARSLPVGNGRSQFQAEPAKGEKLKGIMPDIVTTLGDTDKLGDANGPSDLWFDVKTLGAKQPYVRVRGDSKGQAVRTRQALLVSEYKQRAKHADHTFFKGDPMTPFMHMLKDLPRVKGLVVGMFSEFSQDVEQLLKFCAGEIAERWAVLNGLPGDEALQCVTWELKRQWAFTALRANARIRIDCAHHVKYQAAGSTCPQQDAAPSSVGRIHGNWLGRQRVM